jgi:hypothetical protein
MSARPDAQRLPAKLPTSKLARQYFWLAGALVVIGGGAAGALDEWFPLIPAGLVAGALVAIGLRMRRLGRLVQLINGSFDAITRGASKEARKLLDLAVPLANKGALQRVIDLQRATIALRAGTLDAAMSYADAAVARPLSRVGRPSDRLQLGASHAIRSLIRAMSGDSQGAREDVARVRANGNVTSEVLARAELATAIVLERSGDRAALRAHLAAQRTLLLDHTVPRERAIVRAYQRMLETKRQSVYRESAQREPERAGDEPAVADWIATVVPAAAPFARPNRPAAAPPPRRREVAEPIDPNARRAAAARAKGKSGARIVGKIVVLWLLLIGMFVAIWQLLTPDRSAPTPERQPRVPETPTDLLVVFGILVLVILAAVGLAIAKRRDANKQAGLLLAALRATARGEDEKAEANLRTLTKSKYPLIASRAEQELAKLAERRTNFAEAIAACDRGIAGATRTPAARIVAGAILLPELVAERAFVLAATDRAAEARAEMAVLGETYPLYPFKSRAALRVELVLRVRRGDLAGATALVAQDIQDLPLGLRDETLVDLVRATAHPESAGAGEIERLKHELHVDARLKAWLEAVAPKVLAAFATASNEDEAAEDDAGDDGASAIERA